jgi:hypothetical protein
MSGDVERRPDSSERRGRHQQETGQLREVARSAVTIDGIGDGYGNEQRTVVELERADAGSAA